MPKRKPNARTFNKALDTLVDTVQRQTNVTCRNMAKPSTQRKLNGEVRAAKKHVLDLITKVRRS